MPEISVIVPIYKTEKYLRKCIDSILAQTFEDFELILVDDGSPDQCGAICEEYAASNSKVRVFHKENGGISSARNVGIEAALGNWIVFVDSDDHVEASYLQNMVQAQAQNPNTLVVTDYATFTAEDELAGDCKGTQTATILKLDSLTAEQYQKYMCNYTLWVPYCKLYSKALMDRAALRYDTELKSAEDLWFNIGYLRLVDEVCHVAVTDYHYRIMWKQYGAPKFIDHSAIKSMHSICCGMIEIAQRGGVYPLVHAQIEKLVAEKFYFSRLPLVFTRNEKVSHRRRREMFDSLCYPSAPADFMKLCIAGSKHLEMHPLMRVACKINCYWTWWGFYRLLELRNSFRQ